MMFEVEEIMIDYLNGVLALLMVHTMVQTPTAKSMAGYHTLSISAADFECFQLKMTRTLLSKKTC